MRNTNSIEGFFKSVLSEEVFEIRAIEGTVNIKRTDEERLTELTGGAQGWLWGYYYSVKSYGNDILLSRGLGIGENLELCRRIDSVI